MRLTMRVLMGYAALVAVVLLVAALLQVPPPALMILGSVAIVTALIINYLVTRHLNRPLRDLTLASQQVAAGDFQPIALHDAPQEFAVLATSFNQMVDSLRGRDQQLQSLNDQLSRRLRELDALYEVSRSVNATLDLDEVLRTILNETVRTFPTATKGLIHLVDESGKRLIPIALSNATSKLDPSMGLPIDRGIAGRVVRERTTITISDTSQHPDFLDLGSTVRSLMVTPLEIGNNVIGALSLDSVQRSAFTPDMEAVFRSLANRVASALENARLYSDSQKRVNELTSLYQSAIELSSNHAPDELHSQVARQAIQLLHGSGAVLYLADRKSSTLAVVSCEEVEACEPGRIVNTGEGLAGQVALTSEAHSSDGDGSRPGEPEHPVVAAPLIWEDHVLGVIEVHRPASEARFDGSDTRLLTLFAQQAASTLENARLIEELHSKSNDLEVANQNLSRASQLKSEFLANMSHELRTPLNAILGFSEILVDQAFGPLNERQVRYLTNINTSGQHLLDLINDILDLSKIEAGRMELMLEPFRLDGALEEVYTVVEPLATKKSQTVTLSYERGPERIVADRLRFKQMLYNIVYNAVKFTPEGGTIDISAWKGPPDDDMLYIAVKDSGIGIPEEQIEQIFDVFHRLDRSYRRETEGTGLGLALVRRFVELHGGTIGVTSRVGEGSVFTIALPQTEAMFTSLQTLEL